MVNLPMSFIVASSHVIVWLGSRPRKGMLGFTLWLPVLRLPVLRLGGRQEGTGGAG